jgi:Domain of unknown function (DUF4157)
VRGLTPGESALLTKLFGPKLDQSQIALWDKPFYSDKQSKTTGNSIYFIAGNYEKDFSKPLSPTNKHTFIHEMTHVLQYQQGHYIKTKGILWGAYDYIPYCNPYAYSNSTLGMPLYRFNMEQQADIIADYHTGQIPHSYRAAATRTIGTYDTIGPTCADTQEIYLLLGPDRVVP